MNTLALLSIALGAASAPAGDDPIAARLYPPELIMSHQAELGIDDKQRSAIVSEIEKTQSKILTSQWELQQAAEALARILDPGHVDEAKALAQADKVMNLERDVKRMHLGLLIRIKNLLSDAQRAKLAELRRAAPP